MNHLTMKDLETFARRLRQARVMKQLSMQDLIDALLKNYNIAISKPAISKYENAKMAPSHEVLDALALALGVSLDYFDRPLTCTVENFKVSFRKKSTMKAAVVNALREKVNDKVERYLEIEQILRNAGIEKEPPQLFFSNPISTKEEAKAFALELRRRWNLSDYPIVHAQRELESHGISVIPIEEDNKFDGLSGSIDGEKLFVIYNAKQKHVERRRLTIMHEAGHQLMKFAPEVSLHDQETLCNVFANEMLLPTSKFRQTLEKERAINLISLRPLQAFYGLSIDALMKKAEETGLISPKEYKRFNVIKNCNRSFKEAVEQSIYQETPIYDQYMKQVLMAYSLHLIDRAKAESLTDDIPTDRKTDLFAI